MKKILLMLLFLSFIGMGYSQVSVTATGGTLSASYTTLKGALDAINAGTHTGTITVGITANTTETAVAVLNSSGAGSASYTSILIYPTNDGVSITGPGTSTNGRGVIELNGADNVTIDGDNPNTGGTNRNLSIINNSTAASANYTMVVRLAAYTSVITSVDNNTIKNCILTGSATGQNISTVTSTSGPANTTYGIYAGAWGTSTPASNTTAPSAITSTSTTLGSGGTIANLIVSNNQINACARAIMVQGSAVTVAPNLQIINNIIGASTTGSTTNVYSYGIGVQGSSSGLVQGNLIQNVESYIGSSLRGISIGDISSVSGDLFTIEKNIVSYVVSRSTTGYAAYGINIAGGTGNIIRNNMIFGLNAVQNNNAYGFTYGVRGIRIASNTNHKIIYNSVSLSGAMLGTSTDVSSCFTITSTTQTGCDVRNNIFSNTMTGTSTSVITDVQLYSTLTSAMNLTLNNNAYYTGSSANNYILSTSTGSAVANNYLVANFNPNAITPSTNSRAYTSTLSAAGTNDNASFAATAAAPFTTPTNLHIPAATSTLLESGGVNITGTADDYDSQVRQGNTGYSGTGLAPDIGADEFEGTNPSWVTLDMGATALVAPLATGCYGAIENVTITVKNYGTALIDFTVNPTTITTNVTGAVTQTLSNTLSSGTLAAGSSMNVNMSTILDMSTVGTYTFNAFTTVTGDENAANNAMSPATRTVIASTATPYSQNFDASTSTPAGWTTTGWTIGTTHANPSTGNGLYKNLYSSSPSGQFILLKLGPVAASDALSFDYRVVNYSSYPTTPTPNSPAWGSIVIEISNNCGASYSTFAIIDATNHVSTLNWATKIYSLTGYASQSVIFRITATWLSGDYYIDFDNFLIGLPPIANPSAFIATPISGSQINLGWTPDGSNDPVMLVWNSTNTFGTPVNGISYSVGNTVPGGGTVLQNNTNTAYNHTSLNSSTTYYYKAYSHDAGNNYSSGVTANATTFCDAISTFPWTQNFEGTFLPNCWTKIVQSGNDITQSSTQNHTAGGIYSARFSSYSSSSDYNQYLFSAPITITTGYTELSFWHRKYGDYTELLEWGIATTTNPINYTWTAVTLSYTDWQQTIVDLTPWIGQTVYIGFHYYGNFMYYVYLDDVSINAPITCPAPSAGIASNISTTTADLSWTSAGSLFNVKYNAGSNFDPYTAGTLVSPNPTTTSCSLSSLSSGTPYYWYVRRDCGGGDYSTYAGPFTFNTLLLNDLCSGAITVTCGNSYLGTTTGATADSPGSCNVTYYSYPGVWYHFVGIGNMVSVDLCTSTTWDSEISVYSGSCGSLVCIDGNDDYCSLQSRVDWFAESGVDYYILVHQYGTTGGAFTLTVNCTYPATATWQGDDTSPSAVDWFGADNWDVADVPGSTTNVVIPTGLTNYPTVDRKGICNNINIASGARLVDMGTGYLVPAGTATVDQNYLGGEWHLISAPISGATANMFLGLYLQNHTESTNAYTDITNPATPLNVMQGYALWNNLAGTASFVGTLNTGAFSKGLTRTGQGWNLVGNPYASPIDWDAATGWTKTNINNATYIHRTADINPPYYGWAAYVGGVGTNGGSRYIAPCQGFFVGVNASFTSGTLQMTNDVRTHNNATFYKDEVADIVRLEVSGNGFADETVIRFLDLATPGFDGDWDAGKLFEEIPEAAAIYSIENGMMAINSLPTTNTVPVGVNAGVPGEFTITATETSEFADVILEDLLLGTFTDLKSNSYTFNYDMNFDNRFIVHFTPLGVSENPADLVNIYSSQKDVYVSVPLNTTGDIVVYNLMGQEVTRTQINGVLNKVTLAESAYYVVKVMSNESVVAKKVFVK
jgi:hypothetical protein